VTVQEERGPGASLEVEIDWSAAQTTPVLLANQFVVQVGTTSSVDRPAPDGVYLIVGQAAPPVILPGSTESVTRQLARLDNRLPVTVHGRYFLTRQRLDELIAVLTETAEKYDEAATKGREDV
jgi:hypothetical protein